MRNPWRALTLCAAIAVLVGVGVPHVRADVVESYEEETRVYFDATAACALHYEGGEQSTYIDVCGFRYDDDGDGVADRAAIGVYRRVCTVDGSFRRCTTESGYGQVDLSSVTIDIEGGTGSIHGAIDSCAVDMEFLASGPVRHFGYEGRYPWPGVRLRDLSVTDERGWRYAQEGREAEAAGTVCDWQPSPDPSQVTPSSFWTDAALFKAKDVDFEHGYRINPEQAPVLGDYIEHDTRPQNDSASQAACGYWGDETTDDAVEACAFDTDTDGDGVYETHQLEARRWDCNDTYCQMEERSAAEDALTIDMSVPTATIQGSIGDCTIHATLAGQTTYQGSDTRGWDTVWLGQEPGEVSLGYTEDSEYRYAYAVPQDGAVVCGWPETASASDTFGFLYEDETSTRQHYIGVNPDGLT